MEIAPLPLCLSYTYVTGKVVRRWFSSEDIIGSTDSVKSGLGDLGRYRMVDGRIGVVYSYKVIIYQSGEIQVQIG